jgi:hypothetical protein
MALHEGNSCWAVGIACAALIAPAFGETAWISGLTEQTLRQGTDATLPPHLSVVLGLTDHGESTPVRQIAVRVDHEVRAFNVCSSNHRNLVIFTVDEATQVTTAYLLSPDGKLLKAVSYSPAEPTRKLPTSEARTGFTRAVQYWSGRAQPTQSGSGAPSR